jgi:hypothetical protein
VRRVSIPKAEGEGEPLLGTPKNVEDDVGGVDTVGEHFGAGRLDSVPALKISRWRGPTVQYAFRLRRTAELRYRGQLAEGRTTPPPTNARREGDWVKPTFIGRSGQIGCYEQRI